MNSRGVVPSSHSETDRVPDPRPYRVRRHVSLWVPSDGRTPDRLGTATPRARPCGLGARHRVSLQGKEGSV